MTAGPIASHETLAKQLNEQVWELLSRPARTADEDELMVHAAHASCYHWLQAGGSAVRHQRAVWLIGRVYVELGMAEQAMRYAQRCRELTEAHPDEMKDFDLAYAYEALARAYAMLGNRGEAMAYRGRAAEAGTAIRDEEDRSIFMQDFEGGNWWAIA